MGRFPRGLAFFAPLLFATVVANSALAQVVENDQIFRGAFDPPELAYLDRELLIFEGPGLELLNPIGYKDRCGEGPRVPSCDDFQVDFIGPQPLDFHLDLPDEKYPEATLFSSDDGQTYLAHAVAPSGATSLIPLIDPDYVSTGFATVLFQHQWFVQRDPIATMRLKITKVRLEVADYTGIDTCPWLSLPLGTIEDCARMLLAGAEIRIAARNTEARAGRIHPGDVFFKRHGLAELTGTLPNLDFRVLYLVDQGASVWNEQSFDVEEILSGHWIVTLKQPISVEIPLTSIDVGDTFVVSAQLVVVADNKLGTESFVSSYFRDPIEFEGIELEYDGVEPVAGPVGFFPTTMPEPADPCEGPGAPNGGTIEFTSDSFRTPEIPFADGAIEIKRAGGSQGRASVFFSTLPDTATAYEDYQTVLTHVVFEDGEEGTRVVRVPILMDDEIEGVERLTARLTDSHGCATVGDRDTTELLILDDDQAPPGQFSVCGTVSGLVGTGLQLRNLFPVDDLFPSNGPFCFPREYTDGTRYDVLIEAQPGNPPQSCSVANGQGTLDGADVENVEVTCLPPQTSVVFDSTFGSNGVVSGALFGGATAMAIQSDGKVLVTGKSELVRYLANGDSDLTFGTDSFVDVDGIGSGSVNAVTVQSDGKIVVAGHNNADFRTYRYNADGSPDLSFGSGGVAVTDWSGALDRAYDVAIQDDGKIVVAGHGDANNGLGADFLIVRYLSTGALDNSFGAGGIATIDIAGGADFGYAVALQSDNKILVTGRVANGGGDTPDIGLVRLLSDGTPDATFGASGIVRDSTPDNWDEGDDIVIQPDGKILITGVYNERGPTPTPNYSFSVVRYEADGSLDATFGNSGRLDADTFAPYGTARTLGLQSTGKIVVAGNVTVGGSPNVPDFAIARYNADGTPDPTFGTDGEIVVDFFGETDDAQALVIQPDDKIVISGVAWNSGTSSLGMLRLLSQ